jgi:Fungal specific transcription factor domain
VKLDIWERQYAGDFPFLHTPTFQDILRQTPSLPSIQDFNTSRPNQNQALPRLAPEFLLAFLTLTSKYQSNLVAHHSSSRTPNPRAAAEYYAAACKSRLASVESQFELGVPPTLSRVQAYLMLALYEWGNCESINAWNHLCIALQEAENIGLGDTPMSQATLMTSIIRRQAPPAVKFSDNAETTGDQIEQKILRTLSQAPTEVHAEVDPIEQETRRRTFWSCFVLERFLSSGRYRRIKLEAQNIEVPLPVSRNAFLFGQSVRTLRIADSFDSLKYLGNLAASEENRTAAMDEMDTDVALESGPKEGVLSRYVKAAEVYSAIVHWACAGGRL